jgi:hypothetical protein
MQYPVPQFIEREARIIGSLHFKQILFLAGAAGAAFMLWSILPRAIAFIIIPLVVLAGMALAFLKPDGRPLADTLTYAFGYLFSSRRYLWHKEEIKTDFPIITSSPQVKTVEKESDTKDFLAIAPRGRLDKLKNKIETKR